MIYEPWQIALMSLPFCAIVIWGMIRFFEAHNTPSIPPQKIGRGSSSIGNTQIQDRYNPTIDPESDTSEVDPRWVDLFSILRRCAFVIIAGAARSGKTVIGHNLIKARLSDAQRAIIFDPDAMPGHWAGARVYGGGDDWENMNQGFALVSILIEARRRYRANKPIADHIMHALRAARLTPYPDDIVTVGLIDAIDTMRECEDRAVAIFKTLAIRGAKLGIHLVVDVQDTQAGSLNIGGRTKILDNCRLRLTVRKDRNGARWCTATGEESPTTDAIRIPMLPVPSESQARSQRPHTSTDMITGMDTGIRPGMEESPEVLGGPETIPPSNTTANTDFVDSGPNGGPSDRLEESDPETLIDASDQSAKAQRARRALEKARRGESLSKNDLVSLMRLDRNVGLEIIKMLESQPQIAGGNDDTVESEQVFAE